MIRLRRPVTLSIMDEPFVPQGGDGLLDEVEQRWRALCEANPAYHDGRVLHVLGVHRNGYGGAVLHVVDCAYRFHAVQDEKFDLGVRPLGVKGVTIHNGKVLLGKRSQHVNAYPGMWEFAPGGVVEPGSEPATVIRRELAEETFLTSISEPIALAVMFDPRARTWEIVYRLEIADAGELMCSDEYDDLQWCAVDSLPEETLLSPIAQQMLALVHITNKPTRG